MTTLPWWWRKFVITDSETRMDQEMMRSRRDRSRIWRASRLRQFRKRILNLSEKVNHILTSAFGSPIDSVDR